MTIMFDSRAAAMLIKRLIQSIRNVPGAILRLLRTILLPMMLRGASMVPKFLHLGPNFPTFPTTPCTKCERSRRSASYSTVPASLAPTSSTVLSPSASHGSYPPSNLSPSMPSSTHASDIPLATRGVTRIATLNAIPVAPEQIQRHLRRKPTEKRANERTISAGKIDYSEKTPGGWKRTVHPEGARYFFNPHKQVFTDIDLTKHNLVEIDECIEFLREKENRVIAGPPFQETQLVIQLDEKSNNKKWLYYFVNHETRVVFWVDEFETTELSAFDDLQSVTAVSHIGYAIELQYWFHCEQYPSCSPVSQDRVTEFCGIITHACADRITSLAPLSTLNETQLARLLKLAPYLQSRVGVIDEYAMWVIARVMSNFATMKLYNFYGQPEARLEANLSVYIKREHGDENSLLFLPFDLSLFHAPSAHIKDLKSIWVDNIVNYARWEVFSSRLSSEWNGITIYSTVMLAVDVSFLAATGVDNGGRGSRPVTTIAIYMSLLTVVGSLLSSLLLARQRRSQDDSASAAWFLSVMTRWGGFWILGIVYSLPFAFLIWAMIFFVLALSYVIFQSSDRATLVTLAVGGILVASLTTLPVWWARDYSGWWSDLIGKFPWRRVRDLRCRRDPEV